MFKQLFARLNPNGLTKEGVKSSQTLISFKRENQLQNLLTRSDQEIGGFSSVNLTSDNGIGKFSGYLNLDTPPNKPDVVYSGYAMFRTKDLPKTIIGYDTYWDFDNFHNIVLRVKGDHRKYFVNIQARTPSYTDLYQHRLFLNNPGNWETVVIPIDDFILTNKGVIQHQASIDRTKVKSIGIGLLDNQFGPFNLEIDYIKAVVGDEAAKEIRKQREEQKSDELLDSFTNTKLES